LFCGVEGGDASLVASFSCVELESNPDALV
jgi:hypothetical protein